MNKIKIYTDGAARGNPGKAGWGTVFVVDGKEFEIGGRVEHATNNQMELRAVIEALKYIKSNLARTNLARTVLASVEIEIFSDSKYVVLGITEWIKGWLGNGWRSANKKPVMNRELWEELYKLSQELRPAWTYVKGHDEDKYNNRADEIATGLAGGEEIILKSK